MPVKLYVCLGASSLPKISAVPERSCCAGRERRQREVTVGDDGLPGLRYFHLDIVADCDFKSPFRTLLEVVDCRRGYLYRGG